jgi:uncharacterized protein (DUF433 family)
VGEVHRAAPFTFSAVELRAPSEYVSAMIDWSQCPEVESVPGKLGGKWVFKNTRLPIAVLFGNLALGATVDEVVEWYPGVKKEQIVGVLEFLTNETNRIEHVEAAAS